MERQQEYVLRSVEERGVRLIRLWFTDILGNLKSFAISPAELENALEDGMTFDGSSIEGFSRIQESDVLATPDPDTFDVLPWGDAKVAAAHGLHATFMPKPMEGVQGSGMHTHLSLFRGDENAFFEADDDYYLSDFAKSFMAGLLHHAAEITAITNQTVNSYKRLVPGFEAPVYVSWARNNRSGLVRVPIAKRGNPQATRVEFRSPDPACNPYLAFSAILAA